jgi:hypothetical protein
MAENKAKYPFENNYLDVQDQLPRFRKIYRLFNGSDSEKSQAKDEVLRLKGEGYLQKFIAYTKDAENYGKYLEKEHELAKKEVNNAKRTLDQIEEPTSKRPKRN